MNHLIKLSGSRPGTPQEFCSATPHSLGHPTRQDAASARRVTNRTGACAYRVDIRNRMRRSRLHLADVHRGDHRSKLAIVRWIVPMIKIIWSIQHIVVGRVLEAGNMQRLGQPDLALGVGGVCAAARSPSTQSASSVGSACLAPTPPRLSGTLPAVCVHELCRRQYSQHHHGTNFNSQGCGGRGSPGAGERR
jgi:hypothetical protein